jgi:uncharacterized protein (DUF433 family)
MTTHRIVAIDWSGAAAGAKKVIWLAEADALSGNIVRLENGRDRDEIADWIIEQARDAGPLIVGLDFAFSFPEWFMLERGWRSGPECWEALAGTGCPVEKWLAECRHPFWGRPGTTKPPGVEHYRACEHGAGAKSVFQIGGAGAVGTGSLRGMAVLHKLHTAGLSVWPFTNASSDAAGATTIVEIYPRLLTGPVVKSDMAARRAYLANHCSGRLGQFAPAAAASEDAFDAAVSAIVMWDHRSGFAPLPTLDDPRARLEGLIWRPERVAKVAPSGWRDRIEWSSEVMCGKPVVKGTRLTVEFVVSRLAEGLTVEEVLANWPRLTSADIRECLAFAAEQSGNSRA